MKLMTIQPLGVYKHIMRFGSFHSTYADNIVHDSNDMFKKGYDWIIGELEKRVGAAPKGIKYPIWAWAKNDDDFDDWADDGVYVKITLEIDPSRVLLSDFDAWNGVLSATQFEYCPSEWERIFNTSESEYIQAIFWEIHKEDIVSKEVFIPYQAEYDYYEDEDDAEELGA